MDLLFWKYSCFSKVTVPTFPWLSNCWSFIGVENYDEHLWPLYLTKKKTRAPETWRPKKTWSKPFNSDKWVSEAHGVWLSYTQTKHSTKIVLAHMFHLWYMPYKSSTARQKHTQSHTEQPHPNTAILEGVVVQSFRGQKIHHGVGSHASQWNLPHVSAPLLLWCWNKTPSIWKVVGASL